MVSMQECYVIVALIARILIIACFVRDTEQFLFALGAALVTERNSFVIEAPPP